MPNVETPNTIWQSSRPPLMPRTARSFQSSAGRSKFHTGGDTDSGYSSRPSTSLSIISPRPPEVTPHSYLYNDPDNRSIAEINHLNKHQEGRISPDEGILEESQSQTSTGYQSGILARDPDVIDGNMRMYSSSAPFINIPQNQPTIRHQSTKQTHSCYEPPRQMTKWQSYMKSVTSKVDSRWSSKEYSSYQTAGMMKHKLEDKEPETPKNQESELSRVRSAGRTQRVRPWRQSSSRSLKSSRQNSAKTNRSGSLVEIHYEKALPSAVWTECKPKKYVTNHKYGNHFVTRVCRSAKQRYAPTEGMKFLWENDCQVWLMEKQDKPKYTGRGRELLTQNSTENNHRRNKTGVKTNESQISAENSGRVNQPRPKTAPTTAREMASEHKEWKQRLSKAHPKDKANVFDKFVDWSMANQKRKYAAISIQRYIKGFLVRRKIQNLKSRCMMKHGCSWNKFCNEYKSILARIQRRCGEPKPSCPLTYSDIQAYMDKKEKYEAVFDGMKDMDQTLARNQIMTLFRNCGLFPLDRQVDAAFRTVFKGCSVQSDIVFVMDCSASIGKTVYDMQIGLIKDIIGHCEVAYDKIRVAVVPYNDHAFRVIDFDSYGSKDELLTELDDLTYEKVREYGQITRTDLGLKCMTELIEKVSKVNDHIRDGSQIPKICFAFTDGKCYHTQLTAKWAEDARDKLKVEMYAVTCSSESTAKPYLLDIAPETDHVLKLGDYKTLKVIKTAIQNQQCLKTCPLCHYAKETLGKAGKSCSDDKRGLFKHEMMELIWMVYCPPATGLKKYKDSLWMSPQIEGRESMKLTRYHPSGTDYRQCIRRAVEERIAETGKVILPTETGVRVREITDPDLAMDFIDQLCVSKLSTLGLVEKVGLNVKLPNKYEK